MPTAPPSISATPIGTPAIINPPKTMKMPALIIGAASSTKPKPDETLHAAESDQRCQHRQPDRVPPLGHTDSGRRHLVLIVIPREPAAQRRENEEGDHCRKCREEGVPAPAGGGPCFEEQFDPDVAIPHDRR